MPPTRAIRLILAEELRGRDITFNAVAPSATATDMFLDGRDPETIVRVAANNPLGRIGRRDELAEVISFLAGAARWINSQTIYVNGGAV